MSSNATDADAATGRTKARARATPASSGDEESAMWISAAAGAGRSARASLARGSARARGWQGRCDGASDRPRGEVDGGPGVDDATDRRGVPVGGERTVVFPDRRAAAVGAGVAGGAMMRIVIVRLAVPVARQVMIRVSVRRVDVRPLASRMFVDEERLGAAERPQ